MLLRVSWDESWRNILAFVKPRHLLKSNWFFFYHFLIFLSSETLKTSRILMTTSISFSHLFSDISKVKLPWIYLYAMMWFFAPNSFLYISISWFIVFNPICDWIWFRKALCLLKREQDIKYRADTIFFLSGYKKRLSWALFQRINKGSTNEPNLLVRWDENLQVAGGSW